MNTNVTMIPVAQLHPHPDNPRKDLGDITELTASIKDDESVYRGIYSALDGIGYEISDMEKSLLDGTHPSYEGAEEES